MTENDQIRLDIFEAVVSLLEDKTITISNETPLIGHKSIVDSMALIELCLKLEDIAIRYDFEFDWVSANVLSKSRSMFRTINDLVAEFLSQKESYI